MFIAAAGSDTSMLNYQRMAWYSFLELLDINYEDGFVCGRCGAYPEVVLCDATTLGFRREYAQFVEVPSDSSDCERLNGR